MRASRLVSLLLLLQNRGRMTADQLAAELEVSVRTIYRDVDALTAAGIPLYGEAGHAGGYRLIEGYRTRLTGLTGPEAEALFLTGLPAAAAELGLGAELAATQLKLSAALPTEQRMRAERMRQRFHLDAPSWYRGNEPVPLLIVVADAVWEQRTVHIEYYRWSEPREVARTVCPLGLVLKAGRWYLIAAGSPSGRPSAYRVGNLRTATLSDETFERPDSFDLAAYWQSYVEEFDARRWRGEAVVRFSPTAVERLADHADEKVAAAVAAADADETGWVTARIPTESDWHASNELLRLGPVEVVSPPQLRDLMRSRALEIAALHS
jgi:predicted DNA-binding transcriptional regulator YafY